MLFYCFRFDYYLLPSYCLPMLLIGEHIVMPPTCLLLEGNSEGNYCSPSGCSSQKRMMQVSDWYAPPFIHRNNYFYSNFPCVFCHYLIKNWQIKTWQSFSFSNSFSNLHSPSLMSHLQLVRSLRSVTMLTGVRTPYFFI